MHDTLETCRAKLQNSINLRSQPLCRYPLRVDQQPRCTKFMPILTGLRKNALAPENTKSPRNYCKKIAVRRVHLRRSGGSHGSRDQGWDQWVLQDLVLRQLLQSKSVKNINTQKKSLRKPNMEDFQVPSREYFRYFAHIIYRCRTVPQAGFRKIYCKQSNSNSIVSESSYK